MATDQKIRELMSVATADHDSEWLKQGLQAAIKLELATLPPYLSALWSIKSAGAPAARSIRQIVREEMLHMGIMCNLLTAVGGTPALNTPNSIPIYPGELPGGVHPGLTVALQGFSPAAVNLFMEIEMPVNGPIAFELAGAETFPTIGAFLTALLDAFETLQLPLSSERQMESFVGGSELKKLLALQDVREAIQLVKQQGEGREGDPASPEDTGPEDLAHYYRFAEIHHGRGLRKNPDTGVWKFDGDPIPFPETWPMAVVPLGGYQQADAPDPQIWQSIQSFDQEFTSMLNQLQAAWQDGEPEELDNAVDTMRTLKEPAASLMQKPLPNGGGSYGPCFRLSSTT